MPPPFASSSIYQKSPLESLFGQSSRPTHSPSRLQSPVRSEESRGPAHNYSPSSPLLHTRFRVSTMTAAPSFIDFRAEDEPERHASTSQDVPWTRDSYNSDSPYQPPSPAYDTPGFDYVMDSIRDQSPTLPPSSTSAQNHWQPQIQHGSREPTQMTGSSGQNRNTWRSSANDHDPFVFRQFESADRAVPRVVVSSPPPSSVASPSFHEAVAVETPGQRAMRPTPSMTQYNVSNFSRPIRQLAVQNERSKRDVIERNRKRAPPPLQRQASQNARDTQQSGYSPSSRNSNLEKDHFSSSRPISPSYMRDVPPSPTSGSQSVRTTPLHNAVSPAVRPPSPYSRTTYPNAVVSASGLIEYSPEKSAPMVPVAPYKHSYLHNNNNQHSSTVLPSDQSMPTLRLPNSPPSPRPLSRLSVYSAYSFYQLDDDSRAPSPSGSQSDLPQPSDVTSPTDNSSLQSGTPNLSVSKQPKAPSKPTPDDYLILGIQHHEANRLKESAVCFERAATQDGGTGVGMLMWGLTLRHAWGTEKDEKAGFRWLRRAAEAAVGDLEAAREGKDQTVVKSELVLAIYEVGQCFFHGWGVTQDKKMAVSYFQVAAQLGDADAQQELGYCLANGKGCKKDLKVAAKWYRAAAAQGASTVGLAWIYKSKYA